MPLRRRVAGPHRPGPGRVVPVSTYRLQVHGSFGFDDAAAQTAYLASLGVTHLYLSPILQAESGSTHGYDVVDHDALSSEAGGREAFDRLVAAAHEHGLGIVVDVVPNHMTVPQETYLNTPLWDVLRNGQGSEHASWFDIDWDAEDARLLMPVLGASLPEVLDAGEITLAHDGGAFGDETVVRYYDHELPVAPGTEKLPLPELLDAQHYRLAFWEEGGTDLNYRRFFDVTTLQAVRVEDDDVFDATHELLLELHGQGAVDGFRIDHPDGLADPGGYLARLAHRTDDAWVVTEKILEGHEQLPASWRCAGTTGYDALLRVQQVLTDGSGVETLDELWRELAPEDRADFDEVVVRAKELVVDEVQVAEVNRLMRLLERVVPGEDQEALRRGLRALLVGMDRYRAYIVPGRRSARAQLVVLAQAEARARDLVEPADHDAVSTVAQVARGGRLPQALDSDDAREASDEFIVRFQQTCGPVMAKGIEDTAFYRWLRQSGANEVGGDPATLSIENDEFHQWCERQVDTWPTSMTTLSTHDTKRSEDVRARLASLSEHGPRWREWVQQARALAAPWREERVDDVTEYLIWQTAVGTWPITPDRLKGYLLKAVREAKTHTAWVDGDEDYERAVVALATAVVTEPASVAHIESWVEQTAASARAFSLGQKLLQLTMPGVPDCYQGGELTLLTLVDPDNRGAVDYAERAERLARLDAGEPPRDLDDEKLLITSCALRVRREHPEWFVGTDATYAGIDASSHHAVAFARGDGDGEHVVAVATRAAQRLAESGGWGEATLELKPGRWHNVLLGTQVDVEDDGARLADVLGDLPVALLVRAS